MAYNIRFTLTPEEREHLRKSMTDKGVTYTALAQHLGVSPGMLAAVFIDGVSIRADVAKGLYTFFEEDSTLSFLINPLPAFSASLSASAREMEYYAQRLTSLITLSPDIKGPLLRDLEQLLEKYKT